MRLLHLNQGTKIKNRKKKHTKEIFLSWVGNTQHKFYVGCRTSYLNKISSVRYLNWSRKLPGGWLLLSCPPRPRHGPRRARTSGGRSGVRCPHGSGFLLLQVGTLRPGGNGRNGLDSALATSYRSPRPHILSFHPSFLPVCPPSTSP